uniref:Uncharacterized protein n=1 Tax=Timema tahoe TaxID=61484 RepID=A0A7R9FMR3_9NEOP|nr:unnamed protein product [Timema tahoe]
MCGFVFIVAIVLFYKEAVPSADHPTRSSAAEAMLLSMSPRFTHVTQPGGNALIGEYFVADKALDWRKYRPYICMALPLRHGLRTPSASLAPMNNVTCRGGPNRHCTGICVEGGWKISLSTTQPRLDPVISSLVYCESSALDHAATDGGKGQILSRSGGGGEVIPPYPTKFHHYCSG